MADPAKIVRTDGSKVESVRHPSWKSEIRGLWTALTTDPMIMLLFPMFFASNYFYTWRQHLPSPNLQQCESNLVYSEFNDYNQALFDIRARTLNNFVYWLSQIVGSLAIGTLVLDQVRFRRRSRAFAGCGLLMLMVFIVNTWGYFYQRYALFFFL